MRAKRKMLGLATAGALALFSVPGLAAITSYSAQLTADDWRPGSGEPLRGNASLALDDATNQLFFAIHWAGTDARQAHVTVRGECEIGDGEPVVLDLAAGASTVDVPGGALSGSVRLTPRQVRGLSGEDWLVELRLQDEQGLRLTGKLQIEQLPPGIWL